MNDPAHGDADPPVAVFDLDDTLCRGDSFVRLLRVLLLRGRCRAAVALVSAPVSVPLFRWPPTCRRALRALVWLATVGVPPERFEDLVREFAAGHGRGRIEVTMQRLREHRERGDRIVVVTACYDPLATAVCRELGLESVEVVAGELSRGRLAYRLVNGCFGEAKVRRLREAGIPLPVAFAYTDSASDLPLLTLAGTRVLIDPSPSTVARVRAALGDGFSVLRSVPEPESPSIEPGSDSAERY